MSAKIILALLLVATVSAIPHIAKPKDFAIGLLTGLKATDKIAHGLPCVSDIEAAAPKIQGAIADIYTFKPLQMLKGLAEIYEAYQPIVAEGSDCTLVNQESAEWFQEIREAFATSQRRDQGLDNLLRSYVTVRQDLEAVDSNIGQNDFLAGDKLGEVLSIFVWGPQESYAVEQTQEFVAIQSDKDFAIGLFTGMRATDDVKNGLPCVQTLEEKVPEIKDAITRIKTENPISMVKAVQELLDAYKALWAQGSDCQLTVTEGKAWFAEIEAAFTDKEKREQGLMNLFKNFRQVLDDIEAFKQNDGTNDFLAGAKLGDIVALYVYGPASVQASQPSLVKTFLGQYLKLSDVPHDFTDCSAGAARIKVSSISFASNPVKGQKDAMTINGSTLDHVELKEIVMNVKLSGVQIHTESQPITDVLDNGDNFNYAYSVFIPTISPSGDYDITFNLNDTTGKSAACFDVKLSL